MYIYVIRERERERERKRDRDRERERESEKERESVCARERVGSCLFCLHNKTRTHTSDSRS